MRTTLTLDPDVAEQLKRAVSEGKKSLKEVVNEALRVGLAHKPEATRPKFVVEPHSFQFKPGIDQTKLNQLCDELEAEAVAESLAKLDR
jgi:hypothetical protein